jgi:hypothetical protein
MPRQEANDQHDWKVGSRRRGGPSAGNGSPDGGAGGGEGGGGDGVIVVGANGGDLNPFAGGNWGPFGDGGGGFKWVQNNDGFGEVISIEGWRSKKGL